MMRFAPTLVRHLRRFADDDAGQGIVWVAVMLPLFLSVIGLAIDGGVVFSAHREIQNVVDGAARAGAMQIDGQAYRDSGGQQVVLDMAAAERAAAEYAGRQSGAQVVVSADGRGVAVAAERDVPTAFLRLAGIETARVTARAYAQARAGIERGNR